MRGSGQLDDCIYEYAVWMKISMTKIMLLLGEMLGSCGELLVILLGNKSRCESVGPDQRGLIISIAMLRW